MILPQLRKEAWQSREAKEDRCRIDVG